MPILEINCRACGFTGEALTLRIQEQVACPACGSLETARLMSVSSSLSGKTGAVVPAGNEKGCCGRPASHAGCAGPGSCCGKNKA